MPQFHETRMGQRFFERTMPQIEEALGRVADALDRQLDAEAAEHGFTDERMQGIQELLTTGLTSESAAHKQWVLIQLALHLNMNELIETLKEEGDFDYGETPP